MKPRVMVPAVASQAMRPRMNAFSCGVIVFFFFLFSLNSGIDAFVGDKDKFHVSGDLLTICNDDMGHPPHPHHHHQTYQAPSAMMRNQNV